MEKHSQYGILRFGSFDSSSSSGCCRQCRLTNGPLDAFFEGRHVKIARSTVGRVLFLAIDPVRPLSQTRQRFALLVGIVAYFPPGRGSRRRCRPTAEFLQELRRVVVDRNGLIGNRRLHLVHRRVNRCHALLACHRLDVPLLLVFGRRRLQACEALVATQQNLRAEFVPFVL